MPIQVEGGPCPLRDRSHHMTVLKGMQSLRTRALLCDYTLIADDVKFAVHKALLAAASDYFEAMFRRFSIKKNLIEMTHTLNNHIFETRKIIFYKYHCVCGLSCLCNLNNKLRNVLSFPKFTHWWQIDHLMTPSCQSYRWRIYIYIYPWISARLWYLHCWRSRDNAALH